MKIKKISEWGRTKLFQYSYADKTVNVEIEYIKDRIGILKRVECSLTGFFESYSIEEIKSIIKGKLS